MAGNGSRHNAENGRYENPPLGSTRDGFGVARQFGEHFFACPYCRIDLDDYTRDRFCDEGERLKSLVLATPENRAYLIRMADEWATDQYNREQGGSSLWTLEDLAAHDQRFLDARLP